MSGKEEVKEELEQEFDTWVHGMGVSALKAEVISLHKAKNQLLKELTELRTENREMRKATIDAGAKVGTPLYERLNKLAEEQSQARSIEARSDVIDIFPYLQLAEKDVNHYEVRITYDAGAYQRTLPRANPPDVEVFVARVYSRGDIIRYVGLTHHDVGSVKIRPISFRDLRTSREGDPIDSHYPVTTPKKEEG